MLMGQPELPLAALTAAPGTRVFVPSGTTVQSTPEPSMAMIACGQVEAKTLVGELKSEPRLRSEATTRSRVCAFQATNRSASIAGVGGVEPYVDVVLNRKARQSQALTTVSTSERKTGQLPAVGTQSKMRSRDGGIDLRRAA
jgi:hypothetical protein